MSPEQRKSSQDKPNSGTTSDDNKNFISHDEKSKQNVKDRPDDSFSEKTCSETFIQNLDDNLAENLKKNESQIKKTRRKNGNKTKDVVNVPKNDGSKGIYANSVTNLSNNCSLQKSDGLQKIYKSPKTCELEETCETQKGCKSQEICETQRSYDSQETCCAQNSSKSQETCCSQKGCRFQILIWSKRPKTKETAPISAQPNPSPTPKKKKSVSIPTSTLFKFIKKEKIIQHTIENEKITGITYPPNTIVYEIGKPVKSIRSYNKNEKLTYVKFHDTLKPSLHTIHEKVRCKKSLKKLSVILDYDQDSDIYWEDITDGESINYASNSEESETDSISYSWIDEDENEMVTKPKSLKFKLDFPDTPISFLKEPHQYNFSE